MNKRIRKILLAALIVLAVVGLLAAPTIAQTASESLCYMQRSDGRVINLSKLCGKTQPTNPAPQSQSTTDTTNSTAGQPSTNYQTYNGPVTYPTPPNVYDYQAMQKFDRGLYGN